MTSQSTAMKRRQREAVVAALDEKLADRGSWCGETHLQKAIFFLQTLLGVPTGFHYILYKYGPFSRELREELASMRGTGFLELVPQPSPYGPSLQVTGMAEQQLVRRWPKTLSRYENQLNFVAARLAGLGVGELEKLATALWFHTTEPAASKGGLAERINELKPHVSPDQALKALQTVAEFERQAAELVV